MPDAAATLTGTWIWIWRHDWHGESVRQTVDRCRDHGVTGVLVRAWNGERATAPDGYRFFDQYRAYLEEAGRIAVAPWTYVYGPAEGNDPVREADTFAQAVLPYDPPAVVIDIEHEGDSREYGGQAEATVRLFDRLNAHFGRERVAFAPYDLPSYHSLFGPDGSTLQRRDGLSYHAMVERAAVALPQVYFAGRAIRGGAAVALAQADWARYGLRLPLRPVIQGYGVSGNEVREVRAATEGCSLWRYDKIEPQVWAALAQAAGRAAPASGDAAGESVTGATPVDPVAPASPDGWASYRAEHEKFMLELAAGADAIRLANRLAGRLGELPGDLAAEYARLNAHFAGRG